MTPQEYARHQRLLRQQAQEREREAQRQREAAEREAARREREAQLQREADERQARLRREQEEREAARRERQAQLDREAEARRAQQLREQQAQQARERLYQAAVPLGAVVAGVGIGVRKAHSIEKKHAEYLARVRPELTALGNQASRLMRRGGNLSATQRTRLGAIVATADKIGLTKARGPLGVLAAGLFLAEGAVTRVASAYMPTQEAKEAGAAIGLGLTAAAGGVLATRALQRASPKAVPAAAPLSVLNQARAVAAVPPAPVRATQGAVARVTSAAHTAQAVRRGVLSAVGQSNLATARRVAVRGGVAGLAALGAVAAVQTVAGYWRSNPETGRMSYVHGYQRRVG